MEESWQFKCSSTMQSSAPSVPSSSSSLELRNQMEKNTSYSSYPYDPRDLRRTILGTMQGPMSPNYPNLSSQKSSYASVGNSFLALLSGPPSVLQCDFKEFPSSKLMNDSNSVVVNAIGGGTMLTFNGLPPVQNLQLGADSHTSVSTRGASGSSCKGHSVLPGLPGAELEKAFIHHMVPGSEKAKSSFSLDAELHNAAPSNAGKVSITKVQVSSVEENSSHSPSFLSNCPRVFCLGTGGYLLISNTGLLGIVCTCHYLHMSVLKFCEHSGLFGGNAGDSVHMEGGETIALWRKLYFQKFGIRIPEDQSDWDWPEGVTATSGLVKSRTSLPNVACNFSHLVHPYEGLLRSGQIVDNVMLSSYHTNQNMVSNASQDKEKRNAQDGNSLPLKSLIGTSQGKMHVVADTRIMEHPSSGFSAVSKSMGSGPKDGYRSTASCTDSIFKNGGSSITWPGHALQDLRTIGQKSDFSMFRNAPNSVFVRGDAVFSNIELKLGQPYQSSHNFKTSDQPASGTQLLGSFVNPSKLIFPEQMITNAADCHQGKVQLGQPLYCAAGPCGPNTKREQGQLNLGNNGFEISNVSNAATLEISRGNLTQNAVASLFSNCNLLAENNGQIKPNNNMFNCTEETISHQHRYDSRMGKCNSSYVPWNSGNGLARQLAIAEMGSNGLSDKGKGVKFATDGPYFKKDSESRIHKETETSISYPFVTAAQGRSCELYKLPSAPPEPPEAGTFSNCPLNMSPSSGTNLQADHVSRRSLTGLILPSKAVTMGLPLASSTCLLDQNPALHREEGNCLISHPLDDNLRILALRQILELSKQQHAFSSFGMNRWEERCDVNSHFHHSGAESSARGEQCHGPSLASSREDSEAATRAQLAGPTNTNGCCDLSKLIRGIPINSKEIDVQGQVSSDHLQNEHLFTSWSQTNISGTNVHEKCCGAPSFCLQHSHNCSVHKNYTEMNLETNTESFPNALKEKRGTVNDQASVKFGSKFFQNHFIPNDETCSVDKEAKSNGKLSKNIVSHTSQWRDVPTKVKGISKQMCTDKDTSDKCINSTLHITHSHYEHENSNMSSEFSAPAVTQLSIEVSNMDSSNADVGNTGCVNDLVVDEGSGIEKCCSSDDARGSERSADFLGDSWKTTSKDSGSSLNVRHQSSRSLIDELKLINSLTWKKGHKQIQTEMTLQNKDSPRRTSGACFNQHSSSECRLSNVSSMKKPIRKRDVYKLYNDNEDEDVCWTDSKAGAGNYEIPEASTGKKYKKDSPSAFEQNLIEEKIHGGARTVKSSKSVGCTISSFNLQRNEFSCKFRPIVCGKYGELSNGEFVVDMEKPAKIVPLSRVLKSARRCTLPKNGKSTSNSMRKLKNTNTCGGNECLKTKKESRCAAAEGKTDNETSLEKTMNKCFTNDNKFAEELPRLKVDRHLRSKKDCREEDSTAHGQLKSKIKEIRKRSIYELTVDGKGLKQKMSSLSKISKCLPEMMEGNVLRNADDKKNGVDENTPQEQTCPSLLDSDSFCCVCGSSNKDETNYLLECKRCSIRVHQACYGISRAPKGYWYCRPCRTSSRDIVCVLCGYGGGAMTRALRSRTIAKSLLRVWNIEAQCKAKNMDLPVKTLENSLCGLDCSGPGCEGGESVTQFQHENSRPITSAVCKMESLDVLQNSSGATKLKVDNSITAGFLDSTTKQWVHMVCGLWTPGTRCPNVDTMSAFDVSCAPRPRAEVVCSICSRPGGSCIKCRVINCSVPFHPWCAHQKGLLQSEVEGVDNENVGFYGRCLLHATHPMCESDSDPVDGVAGVSGVEEITCARTEGYKGRKRDGFWHNYYNQSKGKVGCHVPQEQLNAWIHINGQKACIPGLPKLPMSDIENDCRKEYARYKQGRGWKHLVVYKSGIHALGLYTSRFISRGEMVVEYVGEIVGQRVSDKRENEYQSGRKLQYKSACYFFRIDKEHIIDATCRGGIARFVNHSCLPNCVAKVISIRNEKKVVFFAERDIFPGEEITYDYHFNHEDEGKKIPCFCNSKNCRRYLN